jgi:hypothetical protein
MRTVLKHMEGERGGGDGGWGVDDIREDMTMTRNDTGVGNCEISRIVDTSGWDFKFEIKAFRAKHRGISLPAICRHSSSVSSSSSAVRILQMISYPTRA